MSTMSSNATEWHRVQLLTEPTRRSVYDAVRAAREPQTRDEVAAATGVSRRLAAFHLDLLADGGLLDVDYARPAGRTGPGAGRPAKRYRAREVDIEVSLPPRRYDIAARVLARAVAEPGDEPAAERANAIAREEGRAIGATRRTGSRMSARKSIDAAADVLRELGYEPQTVSERESSCVRLRNCPFHAVVDVAPALVCGLNDALITGILDGLGADQSVGAALDGVAPDCCVTVAKR
jgi:predicted ArsR family transcriptional regulator